MQARFQEKTVWITGASAGIGRALALEFARQGANVAVSARRADRLTDLVDEIQGLGPRALAVACDVVDDAAVASAAERVSSEFGGMDVVVANAGMGVTGTFEKLTQDMWRRQLDVNVLGAVSTARHALPALRERSGRLALVGSVLGMLALPGNSAYAASKFAVRAIGLVLSQELHGSGVSCTTIHPGFVESEISQVDNHGVFHEDRADKRPQRLMWPADKAARVMVRAIHARKREYVFTTHGKFGAFLGRHWPGLVHLAARGRG